MKRKLAVVTTFSKEGWNQYANRMVPSFLRYWDKSVDLYIYPDEYVQTPKYSNLYPIYDANPKKIEFIKGFGGKPLYRGMTGAGYNYRFDAIKFCHKPFALEHCMTNYLLPAGYDDMIWLDADTITHSPVNSSAIQELAPKNFDIQFLGRSYKYSECGYLYFNLRHHRARKLLQRWVGYYIEGSFTLEQEWHDSWLFDMARHTDPELKALDLTGHVPRRKGGGHPFVNSVLGQYMDHFKGDKRKVTGKPRIGDLYATHDVQYWKENAHAKAKPRRNR